MTDPLRLPRRSMLGDGGASSMGAGSPGRPKQDIISTIAANPRRPSGHYVSSPLAAALEGDKDRRGSFHDPPNPGMHVARSSITSPGAALSNPVRRSSDEAGRRSRLSVSGAASLMQYSSERNTVGVVPNTSNVLYPTTSSANDTTQVSSPLGVSSVTNTDMYPISSPDFGSPFTSSTTYNTPGVKPASWLSDVSGLQLSEDTDRGTPKIISTLGPADANAGSDTTKPMQSFKSAKFRPRPINVSDSHLNEGHRLDTRQNSSTHKTSLDVTGVLASGGSTPANTDDRASFSTSHTTPSGKVAPPPPASTRPLLSTHLRDVKTPKHHKYDVGSPESDHTETPALPFELLSPKNKAFMAPQTPHDAAAHKNLFTGSSEENEDGTAVYDMERLRRISTHAGVVVRNFCCDAHRWRDNVAAFIDSSSFNIVVFLLTLFSIFSDDIRLLTVTRADDEPFYIVSSIILGFFVFEIIVTWILRPAYRGDFYFWMELFAAVSLITDIGWIWMPIINHYIASHHRLQAGNIALSATETASIDGSLSSPLYECGIGQICLRAHFVSELLILVERIVRLLRYVRVVKLYKALKKGFVGIWYSLCGAYCSKRRSSMSSVGRVDGQTERFQSPLAQAAQESAGLFALGGPSGFDTATDYLWEATEPLKLRQRRASYQAAIRRFSSTGELTADTDGVQVGTKPIQRVGTKLSDLTTRRVVLLVLTLMFVSPMLEGYSSTWRLSTEHTSRSMQLWLLHRRPQDLNVTTDQFEFEVQSFALNTGRVALLDVCSSVYTATSDCANPPDPAVIRQWLTQAANLSNVDYVDVTGRVDRASDANAPIYAADYGGGGWATNSIVTSRAELVTSLRDTEYEYYEARGCYSDASGSRRQLLQPLFHHSFGPSSTHYNGERNLQSGSDSCVSYVAFNTRDEAQYRAWLAIGRSLFVILFVGIGAVIFTRDAQTIVIRHIERMVQMMKALRRNPLQPLDRLYTQLKQAEGKMPDRPASKRPSNTPLVSPNPQNVVSPGTGLPHASSVASFSQLQLPSPQLTNGGNNSGRLLRVYTAASEAFRSLRRRAASFVPGSRVVPEEGMSSLTEEVPTAAQLGRSPIGTFYGHAQMHVSSEVGVGPSLSNISHIRSAAASSEAKHPASGTLVALPRPSKSGLSSNRVVIPLPPPPPTCGQRCCGCIVEFYRKRIAPVFAYVLRQFSSWFCANSDDADSYETLLLENTIIKVGGLLQIGFGEAGRDIIAKNMQGHGMLKPMVNGSRVDAVFGFCDVRQFTDVTECLQEEVMVFVNKIGRIVHSATHRLNGAPNKNIGDAFLLVWKLPPLNRDAKGRLLKTRGSQAVRQGGQGLPKRNSLLKAFQFASNLLKKDVTAGNGSPNKVKDGRRASSQPPPTRKLVDNSSEESRSHNLWGKLRENQTQLVAKGARKATATPASGAGVQRSGSFRNIGGVIHHRNSSAPSMVLAPVAEAALLAAATDTEDSPMQKRGSASSFSPTPRKENVSARRSSLPDRLQLDKPHHRYMPSAADEGSPIDIYGNALTASNPSTAVGERRELPLPGEPISVVVHNADDPSPKTDPGLPGSTSNTNNANTLRTRLFNANNNRAHVAANSEVLPRETSVHGLLPLRSAHSLWLGTPALGTPHGRMRKSTVNDQLGPDVSSKRPSMSGFKKEDLERRADQALAAFIKIIVDVDRANTCPKDAATDLLVYQRHREIAKRFNKSYRVKMGFGLHIGWAIEGAIGSKYKVDASYLSPHVNLAARLEAATKQYGVPLLISHDFATQLSEPASTYLRLIDCVTVKGSSEPMKLYTFDIFTLPEDFAEDPAINWDKDAERLCQATGGDGSAAAFAESLVFPGEREDPTSQPVAETARDGPPADFKIKVDFARDPSVAVLQTIRRGSEGWVFPDEETMMTMYRAKRAFAQPSAASLVEMGSHVTSFLIEPGTRPLKGKASVRTLDGLPFAEEEGEDDEEGKSSAYDLLMAQRREAEEAEKEMCEDMVRRFFDRFNEGVVAYIMGDWGFARRCLHDVLQLKTDDGPSQTLLRVMDSLCEGGPGGPAPASWQRYRELTEK